MNGEEKLVEMVSWKEMQKRACSKSCSKTDTSSKSIGVSVVEVKELRTNAPEGARPNANVAEWLRSQS